MQEMQATYIQSLGWADLLEIWSGNPLQCSCLGHPWTQEPTRPQSMGSQRVRHDWAHTYTHTHTHARWWCWPLWPLVANQCEQKWQWHMPWFSQPILSVSRDPQSFPSFWHDYLQCFWSQVLKAWGKGGVDGPVQSQESCIDQELGTGNKCFLSETLSLGAVSAAEPSPFWLICRI